MANEEFCTVAHVYQQAAPYGSLDAPAREIASVDTTANVVELAGHGCALNDPVTVRAFAGGELAAPLQPLTVYYAKPVSGSGALLQFAATPDGPAINLTSEGSSFGLCYDDTLAIRGHIRKWSNRVKPYIPAKAMPVEPDPLTGEYPETLRDLVAVLAAWSRLGSLGRRSDALAELVGEEKEFMKLTLAGLPPRDDGFTRGDTNLARGASPSSSSSGDTSRPDWCSRSEEYLP